MPRLYCWPKVHPVAASPAHDLVTKHLAWRHARRSRRIRRAAGAAIVCIAVSAPLAAASVPFFLTPPSSPPWAAATSGNALPESRWSPELATGTPTPIPEPSSAVLLATALATAIVIVRR